MTTDTSEQGLIAQYRALPDSLKQLAETAWLQFIQQAEAESLEYSEEQRVACSLGFAFSDFIRDTALRQPQFIVSILSRDLLRNDVFVDMRSELHLMLQDVTDETGLHAHLRQFRNFMMLLIAWKDVLGISDLISVMSEVSLLAEICVDEALQCLYRWHCDKWGTPYDEEGIQQQMLVIGMGKLGGYELNFSSDIDLIFCYPEQGETRGGRQALSNEQFFIKLGQALIAALNTRTVDGYVFRVDMRLRPYGDAGRLAINFDAMHEYYYNIGREWERYALVKARVISGPESAIEQLREMLNPFIYRRYIDFSAIESLRKMKGMIAKEVRRKGLKNNIKLGPGGIREVEFIGQVFQLIRGGKEPRLQMHSIIGVLKNLKQMGLLPADVSDELLAAYRFLRKVEHALQEIADQQTQTLPDDTLNQQRLAVMLGFADWDKFTVVLEQWMSVVHGHFNYVIEEPESKHQQQKHSENLHDIQQIWDGELCLEQAVAIEKLQALGFDDAALAYEALVKLEQLLQRKPIGERGLLCLDKLLPLMLKCTLSVDAPAVALTRLLPLIDSIACRTSYIELLFENPNALKHLVTLCAASPWIAEQLARYPILLDELIDPRTLFQSPDVGQMAAELRQLLLRVPEDDLEQQMETLRQFKQTHMLRIAAADIAGNLPVMKVSDQLTFVAETVLSAALQLAWHDAVNKYGKPDGVEDSGEGDCAGFGVIAYGKLGGIELGYGSDLDIVFVHGGDSNGMTQGPKSIPNSVFFIRLGQRLIHILSTRTLTGVLYEIDTRLRPSGESGLLVAHIDRFANYQLNEAWTWEHQALVRARWVAGDVSLAQQFQQIRQSTLTKARDITQLRVEVSEMRDKMRQHLGSRSDDKFHLKQDRGGITDIEFLVQYWILCYANEQGQLLTYSDNIRLLEGLASHGFIDNALSERLADIYRTYRNYGHRLALQKVNNEVESERFLVERDAVAQIWQHWMVDGGN